MSEDQKDRTVSRNYMGSHKPHIVYDQDSIDEQDDSANNSSGSEDTMKSTQEIKVQEPIKYPHKQGIPLAYKANSESGI